MKKEPRTRKEKASPKTATTPASAGPVAVAATKITKGRTLLAQVVLAIATLLTGPLTAKQRRALLKSPLAGVQLFPELLQLALSKPKLVPEGASVEQTQETMAILQLLVVLSNELNGVAEQVADTVRLMQSEVNKVGMGIYGIAIHNTTDPTIKAVVGKMKTAMAQGPRLQRFTRTAVPKTKLVRVPVDAAPASSSNTSTSTSGSGSSTSNSNGSTTPPTPTASAPQVPVYTPNGPAGTAPATNGK